MAVWTPAWKVGPLPKLTLHGRRTATMQERATWATDAQAQQTARECCFISGPYGMPRLAVIMAANPLIVIGPYVKGAAEPVAGIPAFPEKWFTHMKDGTRARQGGQYINSLMESGYYAEAHAAATVKGRLSAASIAANHWAEWHAKDVIAKLNSTNAQAAQNGTHPFRAIWYDSLGTFSPDNVPGFWTSATNPGWDPHLLAPYTKTNWLRQAHYIGDLSRNQIAGFTNINPERLWIAANGLRGVGGGSAGGNTICAHFDMAMTEGWLINGIGSTITTQAAFEADLQLMLDAQLNFGCVAEPIENGTPAMTAAQQTQHRRFTAACNMMVSRGLITFEYGNDQGTNPAAETLLDPDLYGNTHIGGSKQPLDFGLPDAEPAIVGAIWPAGHRCPVGGADGQASAVGLYICKGDGGTILVNRTNAVITYKSDASYTLVPSLQAPAATAYATSSTVPVPAGSAVFLKGGGGTGGTAPANQAAPGIVGTPRSGQTLYAVIGRWTGSPKPILTYQWQVSANGTSGWTDLISAQPYVYDRTAPGTVTAKLQALVDAASVDRAWTPAAITKTLKLGSQIVGPNAAQGVVRIPFDTASGVKAGTNVLALTTQLVMKSNVRIEVDSGVKLDDETNSTVGMILTNNAHNWSLTVGDRTRNSGYWTLDTSVQPTNLKSRLSHAQNSSNWLIEWMEPIQAYQTSSSATCVLPFHSTSTTSPDETNSPRNFIIRHWKCSGSGPGWGPTQLTSGYNFWAEDIRGNGGTATRLETDGDNASGLHNFHIKDSYSESGNYSVTMTPHLANSADGVIEGVRGVSSHGGLFTGADTGTELNGSGVATARGRFERIDVIGGCIVAGLTAQDPANPAAGATTQSLTAVDLNHTASTTINVSGIGRSGSFAAGAPGGDLAVTCNTGVAQTQNTDTSVQAVTTAGLAGADTGALLIAAGGGTATTYAADDFSDAQTDTWANADTGGAWVVEQGSAADFDKAAGQGTISAVSANTGKMASLNVGRAELDETIDFIFPSVAAGGNIQGSLGFLFQDVNNYYRINVINFAADGSVTANPDKVVAGTATSLGTAKSLGTPAAGTVIHARIQREIVGSKIRAKVWTGSAEPAAWDWDVADTDLTAAGKLVVRMFRGLGNTNASPQLRVDNLAATSLTATGGAGFTGLVGNFVRVRETADNGIGAPVAAFSPSSAVIVAGTANDPVFSARPTISGTALEQGLLTVNPNTVAGTPTPTLSYQWQQSANGDASTFTNISGETGQTYSPAVGQATKWVRAVVTAAGNVTVAATTAKLGPITAATAQPQNDTPPTIDGAHLPGAAYVGDTLTVDTGAWTNVQQLDIQWQQSTNGGTTWTNMTDTDATHLVVQGDQGKRLRALVTGSAPGATPIAVPTTGTPAVTLPPAFPNLTIQVTIE